MSEICEVKGFLTRKGTSVTVIFPEDLLPERIKIISGSKLLFDSERENCKFVDKLTSEQRLMLARVNPGEKVLIKLLDYIENEEQLKTALANNQNSPKEVLTGILFNNPSAEIIRTIILHENAPKDVLLSLNHDILISEVGFMPSVRTAIEWSFKNIQNPTLGDLYKMGEKNIRRIRNVGEKGYQEISEKLAEHGFKF